MNFVSVMVRKSEAVMKVKRRRKGEAFITRCTSSSVGLSSRGGLDGGAQSQDGGKEHGGEVGIHGGLCLG